MIMNQVHSITVSQPSVTINMSQPSHFIGGNSSGQQSNHVQVTSSTGYQVTVKASTQYFSLNGNATSLPVNTIGVQAAIGSDLTNTGAPIPSGLTASPQVMLSTVPATIVTSPTGEWGRGFHVNYVIPATQSPVYLNKAPGTYTTTVMYTLVPQ